ncbi:hypothetical protein C0992_003988 [Termitomyces sp. T32_za158]|nr:hypothetical protein C0992_003988 [Termitomyces sp. T32_za158]
MAPATSHRVEGPTLPSLSQIRDQTLKALGCQPCLWQMKVVQAILQRDRDVISIAGTGMGKTMTFWMPLLFRPKGSIQIIVTPLNMLGKQNVASLAKVNLKSIFIGADTATPENFKAIENLEYQAVIVSPEQMMKPGGGFEQLAQIQAFTDNVISIIIDEAHCILTWGSFRSDYREFHRLRYFLPKEIPILLTSATLPPQFLHDIKDAVQIRSNVQLFRQSVDRPNIHITVRPILSPLKSFEDLRFVLNNCKPGDPPPPKFIVFFDDINEAIAACRKISLLLPKEYQNKLRWFNADMSDTYKDEEAAKILSGDTCGLFSTESFGMGMDLPDIRLVVQWHVGCTMATLWQRFGRAGRDRSIEATAVLLAEKEYMDEFRKKKLAREATKKRKQVEILSPAKKTRTNSTENTISITSLASSSSKQPLGNNNSDEEEKTNFRLEDLRLRYMESSTQSSLSRKTSRKKKSDLEPVMDDFINADSRGYPCRKTPILIYFDNDKAGK